jgi:hypothetical protein
MSAILACISWKSPIGFAELLALAHIGQHDIEAGLHDAELDAGKHGALVIEAGHQHFRPPSRAHQRLGRHLAIVEDQLGRGLPRMPILSIFWPIAEAGHALLDQEGGDALRAGVAGIGLGIDDQHVGISGALVIQNLVPLRT